jgi:histidinol-phosphatase
MDQNLIKEAFSVMDQLWGVTLHQFLRGVAAEEKSDTSLVTEADQGAERILREYVAKNFPDHGVIGEEFYSERNEAEYQWIVDPIDGTQNFFHGIPTYGTILGIHRNKEALVAIIDHPALGVRLHAVKGQGSFWNGQRIVLRDRGSTEQQLNPNEIIGLSTRGMFERCNDERVFDALVRHHASHRIYFDVYATSLAVAGKLGAMVEYNVTLWDLAATELLVTEAGGIYHKTREVPREGLPPRVSAVYGKPAVVNNLLRVIERSTEKTC